MSEFFSNVYKVVKKIPEGKVTSYGAIARYLASPQSSRMVGWAMNVAHSNTDIPAHRVVNRVGLLTGKHHFPGISLMQQLLENEGITINDDQIVHFQDHFWDPEKELPPFEIDL
jgi:methylated-DNA-protein-cysteine methyltransferase-like protein